MLKPASRPHEFVYLEALRELRAAGHEISDSDIPGLKFVDGRELTMGQVISLAGQLIAPKQ